MRSKGGQTATCHGGHADCIANVDKLENLSKCESVCEIGRNIADADVTVAYCTTDGDLCFHKGVTQSIQEANPSHQVKRLADLVTSYRHKSNEKRTELSAPTSFQV